jgi:hypothetical protein
VVDPSARSPCELNLPLPSTSPLPGIMQRRVQVISLAVRVFPVIEHRLGSSKSAEGSNASCFMQRVTCLETDWDIDGKRVEVSISHIPGVKRTASAVDPRAGCSKATLTTRNFINPCNLGI